MHLVRCNPLLEWRGINSMMDRFFGDRLTAVESLTPFLPKGSPGQGCSLTSSPFYHGVLPSIQRGSGQRDQQRADLLQRQHTNLAN